MLHSIQNYRKGDSKVLSHQLHAIIDVSQLSVLLSPMILLNFWYLSIGIISKRLPFSLHLISVFKKSKETSKKKTSECFYCLHCFILCIEEKMSKWCTNIQKPPDMVLISSFCDPNGLFRVECLNKVLYANRKCEIFRKSIQACVFWGRILWLLMFLKPNRTDSYMAGKTIPKQLGDLFVIVTSWQLGELEAISGWLKVKNVVAHS